MAIKEQAYYVGLNLKHLKQQNITTSQGATQLLCLPRALLANLRSCTCDQGTFAFSPNEELAHAQCPRQSDTKPISLADEQQKTLSVKKLLADDKLERDNGQDNTVKPTKRAG